jgi:hypothetical protein
MLSPYMPTRLVDWPFFCHPIDRKLKMLPGNIDQWKNKITASPGNHISTDFWTFKLSFDPDNLAFFV